MSYRASLIALADALSVPDGGFTVHVWTGDRPTDGFMVSVDQDAEVQLVDVDAGDLAEYIDTHADRLTDPATYFGGWHDPATGITHLDLSIHVATAQEAERLAGDHYQLAYFDLAAGQSVALVAPF